jgi:hypothetical protein
LTRRAHVVDDSTLPAETAEHRFVELVREHIRTDHPELLESSTPEVIRTWVQVVP